jgi:transketolase C-terminal domain/subunit
VAADVDAAIEAAERLVKDGWAPPAINVVDVEPLHQSMAKVLDEEANR